MNGAKVVKDNTNAVMSNLRAMLAMKVLVGIPSNKTKRKEQKGQPINNAGLLYTFEKGSAKINRPPTPVVEPAIKTAQAKIVDAMKIGAVDGFEDRGAVEKAFNKAGLIASAEVKARIVAQKDLPTPDPVDGKVKKYMIATGSLLNAITYVVRKR